MDELMCNQRLQDYLCFNGATIISVEDLQSDERESIPPAWSTALSRSGSNCGDFIADMWLELCPNMPRVASFIRSNLHGVLLAKLPREYHYVRILASGRPYDQVVLPSDIVLIYVFDGPAEWMAGRLWYGKLPLQGAVPEWWNSAHAVYGDLFTQLHNGFMTLSDLSGILQADDVHSISDRWIRYTDPDLEDFQVGWDYEGSRVIPRDHWPDFDQMLVLAENQTQEGWAVDSLKTDESGWGGTFDWVFPVDSIAKSIEDMIGRVTGAIENGEF